MTVIFVSHAEEDQRPAIELARGLEEEGMKAWYYERDGIPGPSYLDSIMDAIESSDAVLAILSVHAFRSHHMDRELHYAYKREFAFIPALLGLTYAEFEAAKREWAFQFGAATSIVVQADNVAASISSIVEGIRTLGDTKRAHTTLPRRVGRDHAPLAIPRQTLEHVLGARLEAVEHDAVAKALREGVDELGDADLLRLLHAFAWSGRMILSPDGLLIFDAATRIVDRLARSGRPGPGMSEVMARLLAQAEKELGLINRHQAVEAFKNWRQSFEGDPQAAAKWLAFMQTYRRDFLERLATYYPGQFFPGASS
jgi:TIR domain